MLHKVLRISILSIFALWSVLTALSLAANNQMGPAAQSDREFEQDQRMVEQLQSTKRYADIISFRNVIEKRWASRDPNRYAHLMINVASAILNSDEVRGVRYMASQNTALSVLENLDSLDLASAVRLISYLRRSPDYFRGPVIEEDWAAQRKTNAEFWLRTWQRLDSELDKDFDFDVFPSNPLPPAATGLPSGAPLEAVKDPKLRKVYEAAIADSERRSMIYNYQLKLRRIMERFPKDAESWLIDAYSKPPKDLGDLKRILRKYVADQTIRERIAAHVSH